VKFRKNDQLVSSDKWLLSYSVFLNLVLAVFVAMYANSTKKAPPQNTKIEAPKEVQKEFSRISDILRETMSTQFGSDVMKKVDIAEDARGLVLRFTAESFFHVGQAEAKMESLKILDHIAEVLKTTVYPIRVEGHTDNEPVDSDVYPSNWELSTARASWVTRYLIGKFQIDPRKIEAVGFADTRPLIENSSATNKSRNRRVEIVILKKEF